MILLGVPSDVSAYLRMPESRFALVAIPAEPSRATATESVRAYLPANYDCVSYSDTHTLIFGADVAGWTMADYVIPRLASGLYFAAETNSEFVTEHYARAHARKVRAERNGR